MTVAAPVEPARARAPEPIDWALAGRIARRVSGRDPLAGSYLAGSLDSDFAEVSAQAEALVADFTGLRSSTPARALVLDRVGWVDANVRSMRNLLAPLTERVGVLLGWFSQRVLGQYDLLVPGDDGAPADDAVYYVGSNVLSLEKRYAFRPRDFRLWIALHECTHRAQFTGVPWLRSYFLSLVDDLLSSIDPDPKRVVHAVRSALEAMRAGRNPLDEGGLIGLLASPEHRGTIGRVQSLMTVLEGHGNRVMNELGARHVRGQERMARVLEARRHTGGTTGFFHKLIGLEAKLRQYEVGEAFVARVEEAAGPRALDPAWRGPEWLPTADELDAPEQWLHRVA
jgi:coenzyme F420 biosynthesis associated uncharacterized protein